MKKAKIAILALILCTSTTVTSLRTSASEIELVYETSAEESETVSTEGETLPVETEATEDDVTVSDVEDTTDTQTQFVNWDAKFAYVGEDGESHPVTYSLLYDHTGEDLTTLQHLLQNPNEVDGIFVRQLDMNGDGSLSVIDLIELWKDIQLQSATFIHKPTGATYSYNLVEKRDITNGDIQMVTKLLTKEYVHNGGVYISYYDYNFNAEVDIGDLVLMKRYYASNPCVFMHEYEDANMVIQPEELITLLKAADSFGVENFIIKRSDEFVDYAIMNVSDNVLYDIEYEPYSMQIVPNADTTLVETFGTSTMKEADWLAPVNYSLWRWRYPSEEKMESEFLWFEVTENNIFNEFGSTTTFLLIPTDANGTPLNKVLV